MIAQEILYQETVEQLREVGALVSPAELHGHLCGRHVVGHHLEGAFGLRIIADHVNLSVSDLEPIAEHLAELIESWVLVMEKDLFGFRLYLPDDEAALMTRLEDLAGWCEGFLNGLGNTAGDQEAKLMKDEQETLADLVEISRIDADVEETDENEGLYAEVSEFVRLAAFNLFDCFRELAQKENDNQPEELN